MVIETAIEIDAPADRVWQHLADTSAYPEWNPFTTRVEGTVAVGEVVKLFVELGGRKVVRKHVISRVDGERRELGWTIRTRRPWLMRGERLQRVEVVDAGRCRYTNREEVAGLAGPIVGLFFSGAIRGGIEALGEALKRRAEG
jgi:hypothetical protein